MFPLPLTYLIYIVDEIRCPRNMGHLEEDSVAKEEGAICLLLALWAFLPSAMGRRGGGRGLGKGEGVRGDLP